MGRRCRRRSARSWRSARPSSRTDAAPRPAGLPWMSVWTLVVVGVAVGAGIAMQSAIGFGAGLLASPILLLVLEPVQVVALLLLCGLLAGPLILGEPGQHRRGEGGEGGGAAAARPARPPPPGGGAGA